MPFFLGSHVRGGGGGGHYIWYSTVYAHGYRFVLCWRYTLNYHCALFSGIKQSTLVECEYTERKMQSTLAAMQDEWQM